jgi:hypothetical protein
MHGSPCKVLVRQRSAEAAPVLLGQRVNDARRDQPPPAVSIGRASPRIRSMTATVFLIAPSATPTRREDPHRERVSSAGSSALTRPMWPQEQAILSIMMLHQKIAPAEPGLKFAERRGEKGPPAAW